MERVILCVFEGEKTEHRFFNSLQLNYFAENEVIQSSYGNNLYHLYQEMVNDDGQDFVEILRESQTVKANASLLAPFDREDISEVYLFFDMEPHDTQFDPNTLNLLLTHFCDENDHGKIFISYPMVEAIRDMPKQGDFLDVTIEIADCAQYKRISSQRSKFEFQDYRKLDKTRWQVLIIANFAKANYIALDETNRPYVDVSQEDILIGQNKKYIQPYNKVAVLSAFPLFIVHFFGADVVASFAKINQ